MGRRGLILCLLAASCAGPSQADLDARAAEAQRIMRAEAVHMPPKGRDPCVGVTTRLTEPAYEAERKTFGDRITDAEVEAAMGKGANTCREVYRSSLADAGVAFEPLGYRVGYGVDPAGLVCAIVVRKVPEPIDPSANGAIELAGECLKNALFAAQFPTGRVEERERVVRFYTLAVTQTSSVGPLSSR